MTNVKLIANAITIQNDEGDVLEASFHFRSTRKFNFKYLRLSRNDKVATRTLPFDVSFDIKETQFELLPHDDGPDAPSVMPDYLKVMKMFLLARKDLIEKPVY